MSKDKTKYVMAKELIEEGNIEGARALLESIDHPKAKELLNKLPSPKSQRFSRTVMVLIAVIVLLVVVLGALVLFLNDDTDNNAVLPTRINDMALEPTSGNLEVTNEAQPSAEETEDRVVILGEATVEAIPSPALPAILPEETALAPVNSVTFTSDNLDTSTQTVGQVQDEANLRLNSGFYIVTSQSSGEFYLTMLVLNGECNDAIGIINRNEDSTGEIKRLLRASARCDYALSVEAQQDDWSLAFDRVDPENAVGLQSEYTGDPGIESTIIGPVIIPAGNYTVSLQANDGATLDVDVLDGRCTQDVGLILLDGEQSNTIDYVSEECTALLTIRDTSSAWTLTFTDA